MTRDEILDAAAQIFSEKGFHATSMQDIARAVNLQKASLYHHVSSKQEILLALLDEAMDILIADIGEVVSSTLPPQEKLHQAVRVYLEILTSRRGLSAVLLFEHRSLDEDLCIRHIPRRDRFERLWRDLIQEGVDSGVFQCNNPPLATRALLGMMNWTLTWYRADGHLSADEIANHYANMLLNGLLVG